VLVSGAVDDLPAPRLCARRLRLAMSKADAWRKPTWDARHVAGTMGRLRSARAWIGQNLTRLHGLGGTLSGGGFGW
jgi:hypothetical protein